MFKYELEKNVDVVQEGFIERFKYALTTDTKISDVIAAFEQVVRKQDDSVIQQFVTESPVIKYYDAAKCVEISEFLIKEGRMLFDMIASKADKSKIQQFLEDLEKRLFSKYPGDKVLKLVAYHDKEKECRGKTLKELGYTKSNLISLSKRVSNMDKNQDLIKKMKKNSGFFAMLKYSGNSGGRMIGVVLLLTKHVHGCYKFMRRFFFYLGKNLNNK